MTLVEFMIRDGKLLTNAHCLQHDTPVYFSFEKKKHLLDQVKVERSGDDRKSIWLRFDQGIGH
ncbi:unnamed protein product [Brassica rapa subsp. trilocularis]